MSLYTESVDPQQMELFTSTDYYNEDGRLLDSLFDEASFDDLCRDPLESDWIDSFLKERTQSYVLTDCMMSLSSTTPCVQSEHSYSLATGGVALPEIKLEPDLELDSDAMDVVNPNLTMTTNSLLFDDNDCEQPADDDIPVEIKQELFVSDEECVTESEPIIVSDVDDIKPDFLPCVALTTSPPPTFVVTCTRKLVRQQPTIIVTRPHQLLPYHNSSIVARLSQGKATSSVVRGIVKEVGSSCTVDTSALRSSPSCHINYEETRLPPTPPGSNYSDSEASRSPKTSPPSSPHQQSWTPKIQNSNNSLQSAITTAMPTSGVLILTDEEKRTLIAEGYPVPTRLPLSKQEEKNLKKVQRKIKNKMSAQESRRKKKDYVETLEKKLEESNQENSQLKQRMENLESDNRSLVAKLHKLQSLASSLMPSSPLQTSTCLMMFAVFFAICLGAWSPASLSWPVSAGHQSLASGASSSAFIASVFPPAASDYNTPNVRARTLKFFDDPDAAQNESPSIYRNALLGWFSGFCRPQQAPAVAAVNDEEPYNDTVDEVDESEQTPTDNLVAQAMMHEDVDKSVALGIDFQRVENSSSSSLQIENSTWITEDGIPIANPSAVPMDVYAADLVSVTV